MKSFLDLTEYVQLDNILNILSENAGTFEGTPLH